MLDLPAGRLDFDPQACARPVPGPHHHISQTAPLPLSAIVIHALADFTPSTPVSASTSGLIGEPDQRGGVDSVALGAPAGYAWPGRADVG